MEKSYDISEVIKILTALNCCCGSDVCMNCPYGGVKKNCYDDVRDDLEGLLEYMKKKREEMKNV